MEDIRKICGDNLEYQQEWLESLRSMIEQLQERTKHVVLKTKSLLLSNHHPMTKFKITNCP